jgi:predicted ribosomally synthesized peptide with nif11-like leader
MENLSEMIKKVTSEQIGKVKNCKTAEEILAVAKAESIEITTEQAEEILKMLFPPNGEISDEDLDHVAGGHHIVPEDATCPHCANGTCTIHGATSPIKDLFKDFFK